MLKHITDNAGSALFVKPIEVAAIAPSIVHDTASVVWLTVRAGISGTDSARVAFTVRGTPEEVAKALGLTG